VTDYDDLKRILERCKYSSEKRTEPWARTYSEEDWKGLTQIGLQGKWSAELYFYFDADGNAVDLELMGD
jgi:hypothetical protein